MRSSLKYQYYQLTHHNYCISCTNKKAHLFEIITINDGVSDINQVELHAESHITALLMPHMHGNILSLLYLIKHLNDPLLQF